MAKNGITEKGTPGTERTARALNEGALAIASADHPQKERLIQQCKILNRNDPLGDIVWPWLMSLSIIMYIEVKTNTPNQVRPSKYCILIYYLEDSDQWIVVPPHVVMLICAESEKSSDGEGKRGQHVPDPFCCVNHRIKSLIEGEEKFTANNPKELAQAVMMAANSSASEENKWIYDFASECVSDHENLRIKHLRKFKRLRLQAAQRKEEAA
jgi:hypothetical protein